MKSIRVKMSFVGNEWDKQCWQDCERIQRVFKEHGYAISLNEAWLLWDTCSDVVSASWLVMPKEDEKLFECLLPHFEEVEE